MSYVFVRPKHVTIDESKVGAAKKENRLLVIVESKDNVKGCSGFQWREHTSHPSSLRLLRSLQTLWLKKKKKKNKWMKIRAPDSVDEASVSLVLPLRCATIRQQQFIRSSRSRCFSTFSKCLHVMWLWLLLLAESDSNCKLMHKRPSSAVRNSI